MNRRSFLKWITAASAVITVDPSSLLFREKVAVEAAKDGVLLSDELIAAELEKIRPLLMEMFYKDNAFYAAITKKPQKLITSRDMRIPLKIKR